MQSLSIFLMNIKGKVPNDSLAPLQQSLEKADESTLQKLCLLHLKSPILALILSLFFGFSGVDRFYKGDIKLGIAKLCLWLISSFFIFYTVIVALNSFEFDSLTLIDSAYIQIQLARFINDNYFFPFMFGFSGLLISYIWFIIDIFLVFFGIRKDNLKKIFLILGDKNE